MIPPSRDAGASTLTNSIQWDSSWPELLKDSERNHLLGVFQERFGIPQAVFSNHNLFRRGHIFWLLSKNNRLSALASLRVESVGLPILRWVKIHLKPTSAALQLYGVHADRNIVSLRTSQLKKLIEHKEIRAEFPVSFGYVILATEEVIIGCALYLPGRLIAQIHRHLFTSQTWEHLLADKKNTEKLRD